MDLHRYINTPLAVERESFEHRMGQALLRGNGFEQVALIQAEQYAAEQRLYDVVAGVAVIPIRGILVHGNASWWYGESAYECIGEAMVAAIVDPEVRAIVLHIDSPGGEVAGCFDLADVIFELRGVKPIWAILDEYAFSAAYALASAADVITVPRTGGTGSIGVIAMHIDITKALDDFGVKVSTIQFGEQKSDYYPTTPLSDAARARMQSDIDTMGGMFVDLVARNRGIDANAVRKTEAGIYLGAAGLEQGLADAVMSPDEAFLTLLAEIQQ